ncbi:UNVERIFIED_CONTAM: hypothetical protein RMT77_009011 [Armadillidium vulgare]
MSIPLFRAEEPAAPLKYEMARQIFNYPAKNILLWVLHCCYVNTDGSSEEEHLASLPKGHKGYFHAKEREQLDKIKLFGLVELKKFDVPLLFKIIELACNLNGILKDSEEEMKSDIKVKLDKIKNYRHHFAHDREEVVKLSPREFDDLIIKFTEDADFLIRKSGELGGKTSDEIANELEKTDIQSRWQFEDETPEDMETEFYAANSLPKTFQEKDHKMLPDSTASNQSVDSTSEHRDQDVIMEDIASEILEEFSTEAIHTNSHEETDDMSTLDLLEEV